MTDDTLERLAAARPDPSAWPSTDAGGRVRADILSRVEASGSSTPRRSGPVLWVGLAAAAAAVVVATQLGGGTGVNEPTGGTQPLEASYALDVEHLPTLLAHADEAFVARVAEVTADDEDQATRSYRVQILESVLGDPPETATVQQNGYVGSDGVTYQLADQPLLEVGERYLLVIGSDGENRTVQAGPLAARRIDSDAEKKRLVARYRAAASSP